MQITFLGTGTSTGVPEVGCRCEVCRSEDRKDKRLRCSSLIVTDGGLRLLVDCSPDFREQCLRYAIDQVDAVVVTHEHYDHVGGIDDLRPFCRDGSLPLYAEEYVCDRLKERLPYCFGPNRYPGVPDITLHPLSLEPFHIGEERIVPIRLLHGRLPIFGYRIGRMAYLTDLSVLPEEEYEKLEGVEVLVIAALRRQAHVAHQSLDAALQKIRRIAPSRGSYLIHFSHALGRHEEVSGELPPNVFLSYDGLHLEF